jgi:pimeloyl-ACP methyl ester carboxylesterase
MNEQIVLQNLLVSYNKVGVGEKTLLFLHGWRSNKEVWGKIMTSDELKLVSCYAIDLPGFGKSQMPKQDMTVGDYASLVEQFISKLQLTNVIIVGHSFGGRVGIKLASQYPQIISKLVLVDAAGFAMDSNKKNKMRILAKLVKPFFKPYFMHGLRVKIYKKIGSLDYLQAGTLKETYIKTIDEDLSGDMKKISCPTLIITGENDLDTPVEFGQRMKGLITNSEFYIIKDAGHFSFIDKPVEFIKKLSNFI